MPIITRYVLSELMKVFLVSLTGMTLIFLMFGLVRSVPGRVGIEADCMLVPYAFPCTSVFCAERFLWSVQFVRAAGRRQ